MAKVTMTLTEALAKRSSILKKLQQRELINYRSIDKMIFVKKNSESKIGALTLEQATAQAQSTFDSMYANINNYIALTQAINEANVKNTVTIAGVEMTLAAAIVYKTSIVTETKRKNIEFIQHQIIDADKILNEYIQRRDASNALTNYLEVGLGSDTAMRNSDEVKKQIDLFYQTNDAEIIDPLNLREKVSKLETELNEFLLNVDTALSVANATITIEVEFKD